MFLCSNNYYCQKNNWHHQSVLVVAVLELSPNLLFSLIVLMQIEDLSNQAQIAAAEKFKAPETSSATAKDTEKEAIEVEADESDGEEVGSILNN